MFTKNNHKRLITQMGLLMELFKKIFNGNMHYTNPKDFDSKATIGINTLFTIQFYEKI